MRLTLTTLFLVLLWVGGVVADEAADKLQGTWIAAAAERDGKAAEDLKGHQLTFSGNKFAIKDKDGKLLYEGTFTVDLTKKPATIDFVHSAGEARGKTWQGVFQLEGDTLKVCDNAGDLTKPRPKELATTANSGLVMLTFKKK